MKDNIIQIGETFYNLDTIIEFKIWRSYIELRYPDNIHVRITDKNNRAKVVRYYNVVDEYE